jgi:hypothetical protein
VPENGDGNYAPSPSGEGPAMTDLTVGISDPVTWGEPEQVNPKNILVEGDRLPVDEDIDAALMATIKTGNGKVTSPAAAQQPRRRAVEGQGDLNRPRRAHVRHQQGDRRGRMGAKDRRSPKRRGSHCAAGHPRHGNRRHRRWRIRHPRLHRGDRPHFPAPASRSVPRQSGGCGS